MAHYGSKVYFSNYSPKSLYKTDGRKINMNFEEKIKTTYKEVTENSDTLSKKFEVGSLIDQ